MASMNTFREVVNKALLAEKDEQRIRTAFRGKATQSNNADKKKFTPGSNTKNETAKPSKAGQQLDSRPTCNTSGKNHFGKCYRKTRGCFNCGQTDHFIKECPRATEDQKKSNP